MEASTLWFWTEDPAAGSYICSDDSLSLPIRGALPQQLYDRLIVWKAAHEGHYRALLFTPWRAVVGTLLTPNPDQLVALTACEFCSESDAAAASLGFGRHVVASLGLPISLPSSSLEPLSCLLLVLRDILRREIDFALIARAGNRTVSLARVQIGEERSGLLAPECEHLGGAFSITENRSR